MSLSTPTPDDSPPNTEQPAPRRKRRGAGNRRRAPAAGQPRGARGPDAFSPGQTAFAATFVNLRRSPGNVGKSGDDVLGQIPHGAPVTILDRAVPQDGLTWWPVRGALVDRRVVNGWAADRDGEGRSLLTAQPPGAPPTSSATVFGQPFQVGEAVSVVAVAANLRSSAGHINRPPEHVLTSAARGTTFNVTAGAQLVDGLEWCQVAGAGAGQAVTGWVAQAAPDGRRILARSRFAGLVVGKPFIGNFSVTQFWGEDPDFYRRYEYGGVPLKGHNGIDFDTTMRTPLVAIAPGVVKKVAFEEGGFGHHILIEHEWGETLYAHLDTDPLPKGSRVNPGDVIGVSGRSGNNVVHLHFGIRLYPALYTDGWGGFCDPAPWMNPADLLVSRSPDRGSTPMAPELPGRPRP